MDRRTFKKVAAAFSTSVLFPNLARANNPLPKVVKIVVPFSPGGSNDVFARALADQLSQELSTTFIVENKPGAGGAMGSAQVAKSAPDGSTWLLTSNSIVTSYAVTAKPTYHPSTSFEHVAILNRGPCLVVVNSKRSYQGLESFFTDAKKGNIKNYGSAGIGSSAHLAGEMLNDGLKTEMLHVPYKGIANVAVDIAGDNVDMVITTPASVSGQIKAGVLRPIGVTSLENSHFFPKMEPVSQYINNYSVEAWWGVFTPAGTPKNIVEFMNKKINEVASKQSMSKLFQNESTIATSLTLDEARKFVINDQERWKQIAKNRNIQSI